MEVSQAENNKFLVSDDKLGESTNPDESGIVADVSISNKSKDLMDTSQYQGTVHGGGSQGSTPEQSSISSSMRNDSGIYSDKSSNSMSTREGSDPEISESVSEGNDVDDIKADICDDGVFGNNMNLSSVDKMSEADMGEGVDNNPESNKMKVSEVLDNKKTLSELKEDLESAVNNNSKLSSDACVLGKDDNKCDNTDLSQREDETWAKFMDKMSKTKKSNYGLVDYEDTDSDSQGNTQKPLSGRQYRKRRGCNDDDDDDVEEKEGQSIDQEEGASAFQPGNDGTPVLIRHSALNNEDDSTRSPKSSDSDSEVEAKPEMSSESESEDAPMEVSKFGPPKDKWRALFDLRQREIGYSGRAEPAYFRKQVQGSLQMVQRFELQYKMENHEGCVNALCFNATGTLLASGSDDLKVVIWDWLKNRPALIYDSGHRSNVFQTKFIPQCGDCHVVSCARDGQVRLADISQTGVCKGTKKLAQHKGAAHKLAVEVDSPHTILSCGEDAVTYEIDLRAEKPNKLVTSKENGKPVAMYSIHSNPGNPNEFCLSGRDHFIRVHDKRKIDLEVNNGVLKKFAPHHIASHDKENLKANVTCACYNYNGTEILGTYNDEDIYLFSNEHSDGADYIHKYRGHRNNQTVKGVNFYGPHSEFIVSGSDCGHIFLWDKPTENIVQFMEGDEGGVINVLEPHPFAPILATSGLDHDVKIWAPTAVAPTSLKGLKKLTKQNLKEREDERRSEHGMIDGSMLWFIMHQLRRNRRRRQRERRAENRDEDSSDTVSEDEDGTISEEMDSDDDDDDDDDDMAPQRIQCNPS